MFREKLVTTLWWSALCIAGAMVADYVLTILVLGDYQAYTPLVTLCIATVIAVPVTYELVSSRINLRRMRDELEAARDRAVQMDRTKTHFFANMSHELRTPLNAILGFSELLKLDVFAAKRVEYANLIHSAGTHLLSLVDDLLDLSRIEAGKLEFREQSINLSELIEECTETVAARARSRDLKLVRAVDAGPAARDRRPARGQADPAQPPDQRDQVQQARWDRSKSSPGSCRRSNSCSASATKASASPRTIRRMCSNGSARRGGRQPIPKRARASAFRS